MKTIRFDTPGVAKAFRKLPAEVRQKLMARIEAFAKDEHAGLMKKMQGREGIRLRTGDHRAIVEETADEEVRILAVGHRRDVYD